MDIMDKGNPLNDSSRYDNLKIARLTRRQERLYTQQIIQHKKDIYCSKSILDYKTNLFTNRLFYNISSKQLTKQEKQLLALGLKFTPDDHQATDTELFTQIDDYHTLSLQTVQTDADCFLFSFSLLLQSP